MTKEALISSLRNQSTWQLLALGIITLGVYYPHYMAHQTRLLNEALEDGRQIPQLLITANFVGAYVSLILFLFSLPMDSGHHLEIVSNAVGYFWIIVILCW